MHQRIGIIGLLLFMIVIFSACTPPKSENADRQDVTLPGIEERRETQALTTDVDVHASGEQVTEPDTTVDINDRETQKIGEGSSEPSNASTEPPISEQNTVQTETEGSHGTQAPESESETTLTETQNLPSQGDTDEGLDPNELPIIAP